MHGELSTATEGYGTRLECDPFCRQNQLSFVAIPWADVYVGGTKLGRTPNVTPLSVVAGTYAVRLVLEGKEKRLSVTVAPNAKQAVRANMETDAR